MSPMRFDLKSRLLIRTRPHASYGFNRYRLLQQSESIDLPFVRPETALYQLTPTSVGLAL